MSDTPQLIAQLNQARHDLAAAVAARDAATGQVSGLTAERNAARVDATVAQAALGELEAKSKASIEDLTFKLTVSANELVRVKSEAEGSVAQASAALEAERASHATDRATIDTLNEQLADANAETTRASRALASAVAELAMRPTADALAEALAEVNARTAEVVALTKQCGDLDDKLKSAEAALAELGKPSTFEVPTEVKTVTRYQTADGAIHETPADAKRHLAVEELIKLGVPYQHAGSMVDMAGKLVPLLTAAIPG